MLGGDAAHQLGPGLPRVARRVGMGQDEHPAECPHAKKDGELHSAYAWINVNRSSDLNFMHTHDPQRPGNAIGLPGEHLAKAGHITS